MFDLYRAPKNPKTLKKTPLSGVFRTKCDEWLTNSHWALRKTAYKLPKEYLVDPARAPDIAGILPSEPLDKYAPIQWSNFGSVFFLGDKPLTSFLGMIQHTAPHTSPCLISANPEYLFFLRNCNSNKARLVWWGIDDLSPIYLTYTYKRLDRLKDDDPQDLGGYCIAVLMPVRLPYVTQEDSAVLSVLQEGGES